MGRKLRDLTAKKLLYRVVGDVELAPWAYLGYFASTKASMLLTRSFFCEFNQLLQRRVIAVAIHRFVPLGQTQGCDHEFSKVFGARERHRLVARRARDCGSLMRDIDDEYKWGNICVYVRHAVVIEEKAIVELRPFEVGLAKGGDRLFSEGVKGETKRTEEKVSNDPDGVFWVDSLIVWRGIAPITRHKALRGRRLGCRSYQVRL